MHQLYKPLPILDKTFSRDWEYLQQTELSSAPSYIRRLNQLPYLITFID